MNPIVQAKINQLKQEEQEKKAKEAKEKQSALIIKQKYIKAKIPEAKVWVENSLLDLIAKEDIRIDAINKNRTGWTGDKFYPKELYLSHYNMVPNNIPIESVVEALRDFEGLSSRSCWQEESRDPDGPCYPAEYIYYVCW
jgi:hypothetical protein